jgi:hypothetical protein
MQPNKTLFFAIIGLAIAIVAGLFVAQALFGDQIPVPNGREKITIRVVVAPIIKPWVDQVAPTFNQRDANTQVEIIEATELIPANQFRLTNQQTSSPAAWLAEASFVVHMAGQNDLMFNDPQPVANSTLTWGAYKDKQDALTQTYGPLSWDSLYAKATASGGDFLTLVIASPQSSAEGLAALISATAAHLQKQNLSAADVNQAELWLNQLFEENTRIPLGKPAEAFAATTGRSIGDVGLLSRASWQNVPALQNKPDFVLSPAEPIVILDFPLALWPDASPQAQESAKAFRAFLLEETQQQALAQISLDRAGPAAGVAADGAAALALQRWAERALR